MGELVLGAARGALPPPHPDQWLPKAEQERHEDEVGSSLLLLVIALITTTEAMQCHCCFCYCCYCSHITSSPKKKAMVTGQAGSPTNSGVGE